jgi:histidine triad (HIT) family protein
MSAPAYDDSNIFARILRGELPAQKVYEDEHCIAIMDVMPQGKGHTLVIPRAASRNILDIGAHDLQRLMLVVQRVARAVQKAFDADGVLVMQFNEPASGQTVFHTHVHVIPRFEGVPLKPHSGKMEDPDVLSENAFQIRAALGGSA